MDFIGKRKLWYAISLVILLAGLVSLIFQGLNLGIDFTGGTNLQLKFENKLDVAQVRSAFTEVGITSAQIQELDDGTYQVKIPYLENEKLIETTNSLKTKLGGLEVLSADSIGPTMGKEIFQKGLIALIVAIFLMVVYILLDLNGDLLLQVS